MKFFVLALMPVFAFANTSRIACHKNSESFIELEFQQSQGVLITRDLIDRKMVDAEYKVSISEVKDKLVIKTESSGDLVSLTLPKPQRVKTFQFQAIQKTLKKGAQKPTFYGCVYLAN